jgi:hypothetical protein
MENKYMTKLFLVWNVEQYNMVQFQETPLEYTRKLVSRAPIVTIFYIRRKDMNYLNYINNYHNKHKR